MSDAAPLSALLRAHLDAAQAAVLDEGPALEEALRELWAGGREAWPEIQVEAAPFFALVARRFAPGTSAALRELRAADLYLLAAYLGGAPGASAAFEAEYFARVARALGRFRASRDEIAEIQQTLRVRLLNDRRSTPARSHYVGAGSLGSWLCISAVRELWRARKQDGRGAALDDHALQQLPARDEDQELAYLKALYRREFKEAFNEALAALTAKERNVLRYNVLKGLNIAEIGAIYRVHRATVARWIARAREQLKTRTHEALTRKLQLRGRDLESVLHLIESQLDVSLRRHLGDDDPAPPA
ncbi:MAG: sigma-70 family RNA polymerase sigma factor [Nannocystaceae bacterium]